MKFILLGTFADVSEHNSSPPLIAWSLVFLRLSSVVLIKPQVSRFFVWECMELINTFLKFNFQDVEVSYCRR